MSYDSREFRIWRVGKKKEIAIYLLCLVDFKGGQLVGWMDSTSKLLQLVDIASAVVVWSEEEMDLLYSTKYIT